MIDISLAFDHESFAFDLVLDVDDAGIDLKGDDGLLTAVIVSLFTDARAHDDDALPDERVGVPTDKRGWWGDHIRADSAADPIGSRLWLLHRELEMPQVVRRAEQYAREALAWLTRDGHVRDLRVAAHHVSKGYLGIGVAAQRPDAESPAVEWLFTFDYQNAGPVRITMPGM